MQLCGCPGRGESRNLGQAVEGKKKLKRSRRKAPTRDFKTFWYFMHDDDIFYSVGWICTNPQNFLDKISFLCVAASVIYSTIFTMSLTDAGQLLGAR